MVKMLAAIWMSATFLASQTEYVRVAVTTFLVAGKTTPEAETFQSELSAALGKYAFVKLVEREKLAAIAKELTLGQSGLVDEATAAKAGKIHSAQILVVGSLREGKVNARAVVAETSKVVAVASGSVSENAEIARALARGIETHLARENVKTLRNDSPDIELVFSIESKGKGGTRGLKINDASKNPSYKIGDSVIFKFQSNKKGFVTLVDIQPSGDLVVLYPNDFAKDNAVEAGKEYSIPSKTDGFEITVSEPVGLDTVVAFFSEAKAAWLDPAKLEGEGFKTVRDSERLFAARGLKIVATGLKQNQWESKVIEVEVGK